MRSGKPLNNLANGLRSLLHAPRFPLKLFIQLRRRVKRHAGDDPNIVRLRLIIRADGPEFLTAANL